MMDYIQYILIGIFIFLIVQRMMPVKGVRQISTNELKNELKEKNKLFIDVRTTGEFRANHIKGFENIPLHQLSQESSKLSKDTEIIVICQSGMRSQKASRMLKKLGFQDVTNVKGGMSAWS